MSNRADELIRKLTGEHKDILLSLKRAHEKCIGTKEGYSELSTVRDRLFRHLEVEDRHIYPALMKEAADNPELAETLNMFGAECTEVTSLARDFFSRYHEGCGDLDFVQDFGTLFIMLSERMKREEEIIFSTYARLCC